MREGVGGGKLVEGAEESNPFIRLLDECRSMATLWALAERTLRAYCLVSTASPSPRPRPNLFIYALLRRQPTNDHRSKTLQIGFELISNASLPSPSLEPRLDSFCKWKSRFSVARVNHLDLGVKKKKKRMKSCRFVEWFDRFVSCKRESFFWN